MSPTFHPETPNSFKVRLFDVIVALSTALDLLDPHLSSHQKRTCLIAARLARAYRLDGEEYQNLFGAAIFHDIGAIGLKERLAMLEFEELHPHAHAQLGALLLQRFPGFESYAPLVRFHHVPWLHGQGRQHDGVDVPLASHLIHLADRIEVLAQGSDNVLGDASRIIERINQASGVTFHPDFVECFNEQAQRESFWLDLFSSSLDQLLIAHAPFENIELNLEQMLQLARFFSLVIDSRSHFTATHSAGVAICAATIGRYMGMNDQECTKIRMAGYLHDLGKLAIPSEYIERHGGLEPVEMARIRSHSYLTLDILRQIRGMEEVAIWAGYHHERLDGSGYPYHLTGSALPLGARIMAIADVYTALTEERPYRQGLPRLAALELMEKQVHAGKLDPVVFAVLGANLDEIEQQRKLAQQNEGLELHAFWQAAGQAVLLDRTHNTILTP